MFRYIPSAILDQSPPWLSFKRPRRWWANSSVHDTLEFFSTKTLRVRTHSVRDVELSLCRVEAFVWATEPTISTPLRRCFPGLRVLS
jgi:hypothetical protein